MPYLNLDLNYFDHPKTLTLVSLLGNGASELPLRLWAYCGKFHAKTGCLGRRSVAEVESLIRWWGEAGIAVRALRRVGFLGHNRDGYFVIDWKDHQGHIQALKDRNRKAAVNRWRKLGKTPVDKPVLDDTSGMPLVQDGMPLAFPILSVPKKQRTDDSHSPDLKALIASVADKRSEALAEVRRLDMRMPFGERVGVPVVDLDPEYCQFVLARCAPQLGPELRAALELRVKIKAQESAR